MASLVTVSALGVFSAQTFDEDTTPQAVDVLEAVSTAVLRVAGAGGAGWNASTVPADVALVVKAVTTRVVANPQGLKTENFLSGLYGYTADEASAQLTVSERATVQAAAAATFGTSRVRVASSPMILRG